MTKEEIKENTAMRDILRRYGLPEPNRSGFIACPFHKGDREPSMKIYEKDYHCYACGENGDIFTFVERMEGIPFREAFLSLGKRGGKEAPTAGRAGKAGTDPPDGRPVVVHPPVPAAVGALVRCI